VKDFFVHRTARGRIIPFFIVICLLLGGAEPARAGKNASVVVGFVGVPPPGFQNVLLNVQSVRLNSNASAGPGSGKWQNIPTPPGIGGNGQLAELQIDLNTSQNVPQLFNTAGVQANTYHVAQILLDTTNPGELIPNCPLAPPAGNNSSDGCIAYPITLNNGNVISVSDTSPGGLVAPGNGKLAPLVLQLSMVVNQAPTGPGGAYLVSVTLNTLPISVLGTVTGSVNVNKGTGTSSTTTKVRKLAVTAEAIGTGTEIASAKVHNGQYTLSLPAAGGMLASPNGFGTLYDLAVAGGGDTYAAERLVPLYPGQSITADFTGANSLTGNQTLGNITGQITDNCVANKPIIGATLQLLIPPVNNLTADCLLTPDQCVTVATANTDNAGDFPLPGTITIPPEFQNVPVPPKKGSYVMEISAPGYDTLLVQAIPSSGAGKKSGGTCTTGPTSTTFGACNLALNTGYITGTIPIFPPPSGQTTLVEVFAEDTGTNNIQSALQMPVIVKNSNPGSVNFTLNVPTTPFPLEAVRTFDLFATTIDLYQGSSDPYQGHTIAVMSGVTGPIPPTMPGACSTTTATFPVEQTINCIGHGSVIGSVANANLGSSVVLSKEDLAAMEDVQITSSLVQDQAPLPGSSNRYGFCAPADTYQIQEFQLPVPEPSVVPIAIPSPEPVDETQATVIIPPAPLAGGPSPTPTPAIKCPTTCSNPDGSCPGICNTVIQPLPPLPTPTATPTP